ncbi:Flp family type IVb pilin [Vibrio astriarenae]
MSLVTVEGHDMWQLARTFLSDDEGLASVEYVVGAGLLAVVLILVFTNWGNLLLQEVQTVLS